METKILSVRVPVEFAAELKRYCETSNMSTSEVLKKGFVDAKQIGLFQAPEPDDETIKMLGAVGVGSAVGILGFSAVKDVLLKRGYTEEKAQVAGVIAGIAIALLSGAGMAALLKMIQKNS